VFIIIFHIIQIIITVQLTEIKKSQQKNIRLELKFWVKNDVTKDHIRPELEKEFGADRRKNLGQKLI
jgi:regulatory protein YycI of two-component signal transduction system YycFG